MDQLRIRCKSNSMIHKSHLNIWFHLLLDTIHHQKYLKGFTVTSFHEPKKKGENISGFFESSPNDENFELLLVVAKDLPQSILQPFDLFITCKLFSTTRSSCD